MLPRKSRAAPRRSHAERPLPGLQFSHPLPYGAVLRGTGVQFVVYSHSATGMRVLLYDAVADTEPVEVISLDPATDRWGDIWSILVPGIAPGWRVH
jgi:glycogen operon protein